MMLCAKYLLCLIEARDTTTHNLRISSVGAKASGTMIVMDRCHISRVRIDEQAIHIEDNRPGLTRKLHE
jgi:hypothetical protein